MKKAKKQKNKKGAAMITAVIFFLFISTTVVLGAATPATRGIKIARGLEESKAGYFTSESGQEDVAYRLIKGKVVSDEETLNLNGAQSITTLSDTEGGTEILAVGDKNNLIRKTKTTVLTGDGVTFNFGVQAGEGGFDIKNTASISGNAFSNGPVTGSNSNFIDGDVISAGGGGLVEGIHASGSAYSHNIVSSVIDGDAYYQNLVDSSIGGTTFPGSADQSTSSMPIEDSLIAEWQETAEAGGVISSPCPYKIKSGTEILGPVKIGCNLQIEGGADIFLTGHIWVSGNIEIENTATINVDSSMGNSSIAVISDNPANRTSSSKIEIKNSANFNGSGAGNSYILFISMNKDASLGGDNKAISIQNNAIGDFLAYAPRGKIVLKNSANLKEVTAYTIELQNSTEVIYDSGLANLLFTSGPSGGFSLDSWKEVE